MNHKFGINDLSYIMRIRIKYDLYFKYRSLYLWKRLNHNKKFPILSDEFIDLT